jgi:hypothetical protein
MPSPVNTPFTGDAAVSPGTVTDTPSAASTVETTASSSVSQANRMNGSGSRLPARSTQSSTRSSLPVAVCWVPWVIAVPVSARSGCVSRRR